MKNTNLYIVGTPIGNLHDISERALQVLADSDLILAEDTRHSKNLLNKFNINTKLLSYHKFNEKQRSSSILNLIESNNYKNISLITDAGMPCISDPGYELVRVARANNINVISIPGPSSVTAAISISGIACDKFIFEGFLDSKKIARQKQLSNLKYETRAIVLFESPHRLTDLLDDIQLIFANREIAVIKEITKQYEHVYTGVAQQVFEQLKDIVIKGEYVVIISANQDKDQDNLSDQQLLEKINILNQDLKLAKSQSVEIIAKLFDVNKNYLYKLALSLS
jgi:16S rRNA (cytidine1402-2'-O)-methyltransferase